MLCVESQEKALDVAMSDGPFGFLMIDCENPGMDPEALCKAMAELLGDRPLLFIGNEAVISSRITQELFNSNEYNDIIYRPMDPEDIKDKFNNILEWVKKEDYEASIEEVNPDEFIPMRIKNFYLYKSFPYDIYMELTSTKYLKILIADKPYSISTLTTYAKKNVRYLYIKKDDQIKYLEEEAKKCVELLQKLPPTHKDIFIVLLKAITISHQYLLALGIGETVINLIETTGAAIVETVAKRVTFPSIIKDYPMEYNGIASKSLLTGLIGQIVAENLGWSSQSTRKKMAVGAIVMDFTLENESLSNVNLLTDPTIQALSESQIESFNRHPLKSAEVALQLPTYTELDSLIESHHEFPNRMGFPNQPGSHKLTTLNGAFNISQYIAAEIDGKKLDQNFLNKVFKVMLRDFNTGNFKAPLAAAIKNIRLPE